MPWGLVGSIPDGRSLRPRLRLRATLENSGVLAAAIQNAAEAACASAGFSSDLAEPIAIAHCLGLRSEHANEPAMRSLSRRLAGIEVPAALLSPADAAIELVERHDESTAAHDRASMAGRGAWPRLSRRADSVQTPIFEPFTEGAQRRR